MKNIIVKASFLAILTFTAVGGITVEQAQAADYKENPFTLVYEGAITQNEPGKVNIHPVIYS